MSSLFYPLLTFALLAVVIAYWAITAVYPLKFWIIVDNLKNFFYPSVIVSDD